jgi:hypothetical protein
MLKTVKNSWLQGYFLAPVTAKILTIPVLVKKSPFQPGVDATSSSDYYIQRFLSEALDIQIP